MKQFTIEGSKQLKKEFTKKLGKKFLSKHSLVGSLTADKVDVLNNVLSSINGKSDIHFILPLEWDKAVEYVKRYWDYYTPTYKEGDLIIFDFLTRDFGETITTGEIYKIYEDYDKEKVIRFLNSNGDKCAISPFYNKSIYRKPTNEEILNNSQII